MQKGDEQINSQDPEVHSPLSAKVLHRVDITPFLPSYLFFLQSTASCLMLASSHGRADVVHELIKLGADPR